MTVRPVDLQIMMPKTTEVSKIQHSLKENDDAQKSILTVGFQEQLQTSKQKVNKRAKAEEVKIKKDHGKSRSDNRSKKHSKKRKEQKEQAMKKSRHHIDIRI
jgi:Na+/phosphate symporter